LTTFGEIFGISLEVDDHKLVRLKDGAFKKALELGENFSSVRRVQLTNETYTSMSLDPYDPLFDTTNIAVKLSMGVQKKVFSQNLELGVRKIELIQGIEIGQAVMRVSFTIERAMKWQLRIPFEKESISNNTISLPQNIELMILTKVPLKYEDDLLIFSVPEGFSQISLFIKSAVSYHIIRKNLLLLTLGDQSKQEIISMAPTDEKFYPIISFVYLQDFKNNLTRYQDLYQIGSILALRRQYPQATAYLKKALETVRAIGDQQIEAEILMSLANVESASGDYKQAAHDYNYALKILEEFQNEALRMGCLISLSKTLKNLNRFQEALDYQYTILEVSRTNQDRLGEAEILVDISNSLMGLGHLDDAIEYQQAAIQLRRQMNDEIGEANNLIRFGELLISADRTGEAMSCYEQALRIKRNLADDRGVADCIKNIGIAFYNRGKYTKAMDYFQKAKEAFQNQALMLEVKEVDDLLDKMKERPYPQGGCEICTHSCTPDIVGLAHSDAADPHFIGIFKQVLRESLASKNMDPLVDVILETASQNQDIQSHGISSDSFAYCLMVQASNLYLTQLTEKQRSQIIQMVQENIKVRRYRQMR